MAQYRSRWTGEVIDDAVGKAKKITYLTVGADAESAFAKAKAAYGKAEVVASWDDNGSEYLARCTNHALIMENVPGVGMLPYESFSFECWDSNELKTVRLYNGYNFDYDPVTGDVIGYTEYNAWSNVNTIIDVDTISFTDDNYHIPSSRLVKSALNNKQDVLIFDSTPIDGSQNPVTSSGIRAAIDQATSSPLVASTVSVMTDTNRIYVYTGSETGYTSGHWYYYNGTAWADGGVYNAVAINTDTTLTVSGSPADAKATGDKLREVSGSLFSSIKNKMLEEIVRTSAVRGYNATTNQYTERANDDWLCTDEFTLDEYYWVDATNTNYQIGWFILEEGAATTTSGWLTTITFRPGVRYIFLMRNLQHTAIDKDDAISAIKVFPGGLISSIESRLISDLRQNGTFMLYSPHGKYDDLPTQQLATCTLNVERFSGIGGGAEVPFVKQILQENGTSRSWMRFLRNNGTVAYGWKSTSNEAENSTFFQDLNMKIGTYINPENGSYSSSMSYAISPFVKVQSGTRLLCITSASDDNGVSLDFDVHMFSGAEWKTCVSPSYGATLTVPEGINMIRMVFGRDASSAINVTKADIQAYFHGYIFQNPSKPLKGKRVSILGPSDSTFEGYIPTPNHHYYNVGRFGVATVDNCWWAIGIDECGGVPLINDSWSGTCVPEGVNTPTSSNAYTPFVDVSRCQNLHAYQHGGTSSDTLVTAQNISTLRLSPWDDDQTPFVVGEYVKEIDPDVIIINGGGNDYIRNAPMGTYDGHSPLDTTATTTFREAYANMLNRIQQRYPYALVICCTPIYFIRPAMSSDADKAQVNVNSLGLTYKDYQDAVKELATLKGCAYVDLFVQGFSRYNYYDAFCEDSAIGSLHPNAMGMTVIGENFATALRNLPLNLMLYNG